MVRSVDLVVDIVTVLLYKSNVFLDATSLDVAFVAHPGAAKPCGGATLVGSHVEIAAKADDPNRYRLSQCVIASARCDLQFFGFFDLVQFLARPCHHWYVSNLA